MKVLFFDWGSYTYSDIVDSFKRSNISFDSVFYSFKDKNEDDFFVHKFSQYVNSKFYDVVFSVNFFPLVAYCCNKAGVKYISWSYDNPLNVPHIEKSLGYDTNYVFLFDRQQVNSYTSQGYDTVYYMPLAVNTNRLSRMCISENDIKRYSAPVSFVGKLYDSDLGLYLSAMDEYQVGYINAAIKAQGQVYGCYLFDQIIDDAFVGSINETYLKKNPNTKVRMTKEALKYAMSAQVTREERLLILSLLANHFDVNLYSRECPELLSKVHFKGSCRYLDEMPKIFRLSSINLNMTLKIIQSGIPLRALDIMGAEGFLLSNYQQDLAEYFQNGNELVMYESVGDAFDKVNYYLNHDEERKKIAKNGYIKVSEDFSYTKMLGLIFEQSGISL